MLVGSTQKKRRTHPPDTSEWQYAPFGLPKVECDLSPPGLSETHAHGSVLFLGGPPKTDFDVRRSLQNHHKRGKWVCPFLRSWTPLNGVRFSALLLKCHFKTTQKRGALQSTHAQASRPKSGLYHLGASTCSWCIVPSLDDLRAVGTRTKDSDLCSTKPVWSCFALGRSRVHAWTSTCFRSNSWVGLFLVPPKKMVFLLFPFNSYNNQKGSTEPQTNRRHPLAMTPPRPSTRLPRG